MKCSKRIMEKKELTVINSILAHNPYLLNDFNYNAKITYVGVKTAPHVEACIKYFKGYITISDGVVKICSPNTNYTILLYLFLSIEDKLFDFGYMEKLLCKHKLIKLYIDYVNLYKKYENKIQTTTTRCKKIAARRISDVKQMVKEDLGTLIDIVKYNQMDHPLLDINVAQDVDFMLNIHDFVVYCISLRDKYKTNGARIYTIKEIIHKAVRDYDNSLLHHLLTKQLKASQNTFVKSFSSKIIHCVKNLKK